MPVYGNAWEGIKRRVVLAVNWIVGKFTKPDPPDDPDPEPEEQ